MDTEYSFYSVLSSAQYIGSGGIASAPAPDLNGGELEALLESSEYEYIELEIVAIPDSSVFDIHGASLVKMMRITRDALGGAVSSRLANQSTDVESGCLGTNIPRAEGTGIAAGERNTHDILHGCTTAGIAAELAADYVSSSGYQDWYLPSKDDLDLMYQNLHLAALGGFTSDYYWSSSEFNDNGAWSQNFDFGFQSGFLKDNTYGVSAVRVF